MALATTSSLKGHKSSNEPPPRPTIRVSIPYISFTSLASFILFAISLAAFSPCTRAGNKMVLHTGNLLLIVVNISLIAAPVGDVTMPIVFGTLLIFFFLSLSNNPSA